MSTKNSINNKSQDITVDPGASGDSFVQFDINGTGEFRIGVDDDASDAFKVSQGSALGTTDTFIVTAAGEITMPLQSAFLAYLGTTDSNVTGDSTTFKLGSGNALTEVYDQNNDFATDTFTAPVTGRYCLCASVRFSGLASGNTQGWIQVNTSNDNYLPIFGDFGNLMDSGNEFIGNVCVQCDMDAADVAYINVQVQNGTKIVDITSNNRDTFFAGFLMC